MSVCDILTYTDPINMCVSICVEVNGQVLGVGSFYHVGPRLKLRLPGLVTNAVTR